MWGIIILILVYILFLFVRPFLPKQRKKEGGYLEKTASVVREGPPEKTVLQYFFIISTVLFIIPLLMGVGYSHFFEVGRNNAKEQKEFLLFKFNPEEIKGVEEVAIVRAYGDNLLAVPINRTKNEFEKKVVILKISEMSKRLLTLENIGRLQAKP